MSSEVAALQADIKDYQEQLDTVVSSLQDDPDNAELQTLKTELEEAIAVTQSAISEIAPASAPQEQKPPPPPPGPVEEKWSKEKHPAFQPGYKRPGAPPSPPPDEPPAAASFKVNDTVLAKWLSGDKAFYPARITAITGSSAAPIYNVTFKGYNNSETLRASDIKPVFNDPKKRKADGPPASQSLPATASSNVISAAADIDPALASQAKREPSKVSDGPTRPPKVPRKVKATKELEAGKSKWQDFSTKGKFAKTAKKDSMFRTGEGINARVGFTGSGHAMRKDPTRSKHIYQASDDD